MKKIAYWACVLAMAVSTQAASYKIAGYPIPLMIENSDSGLFVEIIKELIQRTGEDFEIVVYPAQRTVAAFHAGEGRMPPISPARSTPVGLPKPYLSMYSSIRAMPMSSASR